MAAESIVLWVHWQADGRVSAADLHLLRSLQAQGHCIVAVGNRDDQGSGAFAASLHGVAATVLQRQNVGYDFAAFRDGLLWLRHRLPDAARVIVMNNSTYGPWGNLSSLLASADPRHADVWAVTESLELQRHLQSYLLVLHPAALRNAGFWRHWERVRPPVRKMDVVARCEIPLAATLAQAGLRTAALLPYAELSQRALDTPLSGASAADGTYAKVFTRLLRDEPLNPTHHLWRWLVEAGVPLVKKDLLRVNPPALPDVAAWEGVLAARNPELAVLVRQDLEEEQVRVRSAAAR